MLIYLHGFNSVYDSNSEKITTLSKDECITGFTYDSFASREDILKELIQKCSDIEDKVFVGTSIGAYYAAALAEHFGSPSILLNPVVDPHEYLSVGIGKDIKNYYTGEVNVLTENTVNSYTGKTLNLNVGEYEYVPFVCVDTDDEVINQKNAHETFKDFLLDVKNGGTHRYDHMKEVLPKIEEYVNTCEYVANINT